MRILWSFEALYRNHKQLWIDKFCCISEKEKKNSCEAITIFMESSIFWSFYYKSTFHSDKSILIKLGVKTNKQTDKQYMFSAIEPFC